MDTEMVVHLRTAKEKGETMSIAIETFLLCDAQTSPDCELSFGTDRRDRRGWQQRRSAAEDNGWLYIAKKDICEQCAKEMKPKRKAAK